MYRQKHSTYRVQHIIGCLQGSNHSLWFQAPAGDLGKCPLWIRRDLCVHSRWGTKTASVFIGRWLDAENKMHACTGTRSQDDYAAMGKDALPFAVWMKVGDGVLSETSQARTAPVWPHWSVESTAAASVDQAAAWWLPGSGGDGGRWGAAGQSAWTFLLDLGIWQPARRV